MIKRWLQIFFLLTLLFFTALVFVSYQITLPLIPPSSDRYLLKFYDYAGITHIHSDLSTGSGSLETIAQAARKAGCDFIIYTDLNQTKPPAEAEGYKQNTLTIWAGEYSFLSGHLLAYNVPSKTKLQGAGQNQLIFNDWLSQKTRPLSEGFLVAAHPTLRFRRLDKLDWPGLNGMEVLNLESLWRARIEKNKLSVLWSLLILPLNSDLAYLRLLKAPSEEVHLWDEISKKKLIYGFAGNDSTANALQFRGRSLNFPSYTRSFRLVKNHVLLKSELTGLFNQDRKKILEALGSGSFYFSVDLIGDPTGFVFYGRQNKQEHLMGETLQHTKGAVKFIADMGRQMDIPFEILLYQNGQVVERSNKTRLEYETKTPGTYRVAVRIIPSLPIPDGKQWLPWIYSNPIRLE